MSAASKIILGPLAIPMRALASSGIEVSGILVGTRDGDEVKAYYMHLTGNVLQSSVEFEAEPWQVVQAHVSAEKYGLEVVGVFHTHPTCPPAPSRKDVEGMKKWPYIWVIACRDEVAAWTPEESPRMVKVE